MEGHNAEKNRAKGIHRQGIDKERVRRGLTRLADTPGYYEGMRPVDHIELAAKNGLGTADLEHINVDQVQL